MSKTPATDWYQDDHEDYDDDPGECFECGGEGVVWDCFDGFCENAEDGCEDCTRTCPECARRKRDRQREEQVQAGIAKDVEHG